MSKKREIKRPFSPAYVPTDCGRAPLCFCRKRDARRPKFARSLGHRSRWCSATLDVNKRKLAASAILKWETKNAMRTKQHPSLYNAVQILHNMLPIMLTKRLIFNGEPGWDRTNDHLIKSQMLYR
jgi:hypothetical protein